MQEDTKLVWKIVEEKCAHQRLRNFQRNGFINSFEQQKHQMGKADLILIKWLSWLLPAHILDRPQHRVRLNLL